MANLADHGHDDLDRWVAREILSLEPMLNRFLQRKWRDKAEIPDLRQEAYIRVYDAARRNRPQLAKPFLFLTVRNLMIDRLRQKSIVSIETMADLGWSAVSDDKPSPEQNAAARQELRCCKRRWMLYRSAAARSWCCARSRACRSAMSPGGWT